MRMLATVAAIACAFGALAGPANADDLTGASVFLCSAVQATYCTEEDCFVAPPWEWNIPQFIQIDLGARIMSTTPASGERRQTPIKHLEREGGLIVLQGVEGRRAFSFVITEKSGFASVAIAKEGITVGVFGACTPTDAAGRGGK